MRLEKRKSGIWAHMVGAIAVQGMKDYQRQQPSAPTETPPKRVWHRKKNIRKMQRESRRRNR